jgi:hypothetical protein
MVWAQSDEEGFIADRPGVTTGIEVLPKGRVQWETGMVYERSKFEGPTTTTWVLNSSLLRYGISESAEVRLQGDYLYTNCEGTHIYSFSNIAIGTKAKLFEGWKTIPTVSLLANILVSGDFIPSFGGEEEDSYLPKEWGGQMGLLFQNELASWCSLGYEADLIWSDSARPTFFWGASLTFQLNNRLSLMAEEYNDSGPDGHENWMELGAAYMLTPRLQLDLSTDICLHHTMRYFNLQVGIAWQINR